MKTVEIRKRWLNFFEAKGHTVVPSASLVSQDPSLLFTVAGMVPFIPYLSGQQKAPYSKATSVQKCVRTLDIEEVGKTARHGTFFQMNGNFSFGDYFKKEAITYAWELLTTSVSAGGYGIDENKLWVTVYVDDDQALNIWHDLIGLPLDRIQKFGKEDNYWSTGQAGPAGPCSEIYYDRGVSYGASGGPAVNEDRYIEIWNLVFMQYQRGPGIGKTDFDIVGELPQKNIDTGLGLERLATILQGVDNIYETDQVRPVLDKAAQLSNKIYGQNTGHKDDVSLRVVADHVRTALMLIGDGVKPANEGRGYVLRRLLRRAINSMYLLGVDQIVLPELLPVSMEVMKEVYPELETDFGRISKVAYTEEKIFRNTIVAGSSLLRKAIAGAKVSKQISGFEAFTLHDTYGFPIDLTVDLAKESAVEVDLEGFRDLMKQQKQRSQKDSRTKKNGTKNVQIFSELKNVDATNFTGYEQLKTMSKVCGLVKDNEIVSKAVAGDTVEVILKDTPFYAEAGGQESDVGTIVSADFKLQVIDVQRPLKNVIAHKVLVESGEIVCGVAAEAIVDSEWRLGARQSHSATHILHAALRSVLGSEAVQAGSYNKPGFLRLDFSWGEALSQKTFSEIEEVVNLAVRANLLVQDRYMTLAEAKSLGALALFGENYDEQKVRVVEIGGDWSRELCGGTHVESSAEVNLVTLLGDFSVGSGVRRVEAFVGIEALRYLLKARDLTLQTADMLKVPKEQVLAKIETNLVKLKTTEKELDRFKKQEMLSRVKNCLGDFKNILGAQILVSNIGEVANSEYLRQMALELKQTVKSGICVVALFGVIKNKPSIVVAVNTFARDTGIRARVLVNLATNILGGGGGGKDDFAQGAGKNLAALSEAVKEIEANIVFQLKV